MRAPRTENIAGWVVPIATPIKIFNPIKPQNEEVADMAVRASSAIRMNTAKMRSGCHQRAITLFKKAATAEDAALTPITKPICDAENDNSAKYTGRKLVCKATAPSRTEEEAITKKTIGSFSKPKAAP